MNKSTDTYTKGKYFRSVYPEKFPYLKTLIEESNKHVTLPKHSLAKHSKKSKSQTRKPLMNSESFLSKIYSLLPMKASYTQYMSFCRYRTKQVEEGSEHRNERGRSSLGFTSNKRLLLSYLGKHNGIISHKRIIPKLLRSKLRKLNPYSALHDPSRYKVTK
jgi:hypothetical protein